MASHLARGGISAHHCALGPRRKPVEIPREFDDSILFGGFIGFEHPTLVMLP